MLFTLQAAVLGGGDPHGYLDQWQPAVAPEAAGVSPTLLQAIAAAQQQLRGAEAAVAARGVLVEHTTAVLR
jgi:hypothetical protein